jgi:hypothetical protein
MPYPSNSIAFQSPLMIKACGEAETEDAKMSEREEIRLFDP